MRHTVTVLAAPLLAALVLAANTGCAGVGKPLSMPPRPVDDDPIEGSADEEIKGDPFAIEGSLREEPLPLLKGPQPAFAEVALADPPEGVPPPPATCEVLAKHATTTKEPCADLAAAKIRLDAALAVADPTQRDKALAQAETCSALPPGLVRSLRTELAPVECGDALVRPFFASKPEKVPGAIHHALVGQAIAGRLRRSVTPPPKLDPPHTKERVGDFHKGPIKTWLEAQAKAVQTLAGQGAQLGSYGKGVVAVESGMADLRLVEAVRAVPVPGTSPRTRSWPTRTSSPSTRRSSRARRAVATGRWWVFARWPSPV
jgi:hypothetical protein